MNPSDTVRPGQQVLLSDNWGKLTRYTFHLKRRDGVWQEQVREVYDRGNGVACLLHNPDTDCVLLVRQFRLPVHVADGAGYLIEVPAGLQDGSDPQAHMKVELEEETGFRIDDLALAFSTFMSPGSVSERVACYTGTYRARDRVADGGGHPDEGEDIEVMHVPFDDAMAMIGNGQIADAKTVMLLQHMALQRAGLARTG